MKYLCPGFAAFLATAALLPAQVPSPAPDGGAMTGSASPLFRFQFGAETARPGFTVVAPQTTYAAGIGYGFEPGSAATPTRKEERGAITAGRPFAFSVTLPEGNYRVTVTLGDPAAAATTTVKAEARRLMLESVHTAAGEFTTRTFMVNVRRPQISTGGRVNLDSREWDPAANRAVSAGWDDKLTLTFSDAHPALAALEIEKAEPITTLFILGDSTVTDQSRGPGSSWGQMIPRWFQPAVVVANHAESGETLKGFLKERRWDKVLDSIKPGDYVLIEFGTNDSKDKGPQNMYPNQDFAETYAPAATTYRELLRRFVADARKKGAIPIIASPSARRGEVRAPSSLGAYAAAAMATARELGVPGIDLNAMGLELNAALGAEAGRQFNDRTHHVEYGSYLQAKCIVEGIKRSGLGLAQYIVDDFGDFDPSHPEPVPAHFTLPPDPAGRRSVDRPAAGATPTGL